jgi:CRISPR-associated protein Cmr3
MTKYLIKLTPCGKFFFGGDMKFKRGNNDEKFSSYIIKSCTIPQQTSLLGMLRFLLLSHAGENVFKGNCIQSVKSAEELIGKESFSVNSGKEKNFGVIKGIGPCFIMDSEGKSYFKAPITDNFSSISKDDDSVTAYINGEKKTVHKLNISDNEIYTGKCHLESVWKSTEGDTKLTDGDIFIQDQRLGIALGKNGKTEENAFYKQHFYRMKPQYCFAFEAEVDKELQELPQHDVVKLGADDSMFFFEAEVIQQVTYPTKKEKGFSLTLLSDAYLPEGISGASYAITTTRAVRFLCIGNNTDSSSYSKSGDSGFKTSKRIEMYEAGSVFFFDNSDKMNEFQKKLDMYKEFIQIGYNKYY